MHVKSLFFFPNLISKFMCFKMILEIWKGSLNMKRTKVVNILPTNGNDIGNLKNTAIGGTII